MKLNIKEYFHSVHCKCLYVTTLFLAFLSTSGNLTAQTDFAPGEIMFTGYNSDAPDGFSFVLLNSVVSGTVIAITDRGWSNTGGFRADNTTEGTIELTFTANFPCGTQIFFTDSEDANDWDNPVNENNVVVGTVVILGTGDGDGPELGTSGDQLFIYQNPIPTAGNQANFVTMIHMDGAYVNSNSDDNSNRPNGLSTAQVVRFNTEWNDAKYDCSPNSGIGSFLQSVITNDNGSGTLVADDANNWNEADSPFTLTPGCSFCCGSSPGATPVLSGLSQVTVNQTFTISFTGVLSPGFVWQLYTAGCGSGSPLQTTTGNSFIVTAPGAPATVTYYVRSSQALTCPANCGTLTVCVDSDLLALCTTCTANIELCGPCFLPDPFPNPPMDSGCYSQKLIFILDESGSIGTPINYSTDVKNGVLAFLNALNGQNAQAAMIEFSNLGRVVNDYTTVDDIYIANITNYFNGIPYNGRTYNPSGGTNWHDAMIKADAMSSANLLLFFTDGEPTSYTQANGNEATNCGGGTDVPDIVNPVKIANKLKSEGTHMFMLGVGAGVIALNLQRMSGFIPYQSGINTMATSDYSIGNFQTLAVDLHNFVNELCQSTVEVLKDITGPSCNGQVEFRFRIINLGTESSATGVDLRDTFPPGYSNPTYTGPDIKICIESSCAPYILPTNAFFWRPYSIPPGDTVTLLLTVNLINGGPLSSYINTAWVTTDNAGSAHGTFSGSFPAQDLPPVIFCPPNVTIECSASTLPANTGMATGYDPEGSPVEFSYLDVNTTGSCPQPLTISRIWKITDGCSAATCTQTISLVDTSPPTLMCPPNISVDCAASTLPVSTGTATATDLCDANPTVSLVDVIVAGTCPTKYTVRRTWKATDQCGNMGTCLQLISVNDNTPPEIVCKDASIQCEQSILPENTGFPIESNNCGGTSTATYSDVFIYQEATPQCSIQRTWTVADQCGNSSTCIQTITIRDSSIPTIFCPANITIACTASTFPGNTGSATATDNCSISPSISYTDALTTSPTCLQNYSISRTWRAVDECGNTAYCNQNITIVDTAPPSLTCPGNVIIACTASTLPANTGTATSLDNCSTFAISYIDIVVAGACPQESTITRQWKSIDACGNSSTCNQVITVRDQSPPVMTCPINVTIQCTASTLPATTGSATANDNCSTFVITSTDVIVSGSCPQQKTITRTWKATDACGNFSTCNQIITIIDTNPPVITCPVNVTINCTASTSPANTGNATATDNCSTFTITSTDVEVSGICPQEKIITRTWKATDACGNFNTCNQVITIHDSTPPSMTCPGNVTIQCTASTLPANTGTSAATDNCSTFSISYTDVTISGACPQAYAIMRTWKATDACNNFNTCNQIITIVDTTAPVITCPANLTIECTSSTLPATTGTATAIDNCSTFGITSTDVILPGDCPQEKTIIRNWKATDACGNVSSCNQTITVEDSTHPVITCPPNITIECTANTLPVNTGSPTATDNCSTFVFASTDIITSGPCAQESTIMRTWKVTDVCGNSTICTQSIFIHDSTPPFILCPSDITVQCISSTMPEQTGVATTTDNCDSTPLITHNDVTVSGPTLHGYSIARTWASRDACGNQSTCIQHIIVANPIDPSITGSPADTICSRDVEVFTAINQGFGNVNYSWNFGSGASPSSATGIGPHSVTYTYNGTNGTVGAWVLLTVSFPGCASVTDTVSNIHVNAIPVASISTALTQNPCVLGLVTFQSQIPQIAGYSYAWNFGSGASIPSATGYGPYTIEYFTPGSKTIRLIVNSNEAGSSCSDTTTLTITVDDCPGNISGRVIKSDGTPISNVNVRLYADQNLDGVQDNTNIVKNAFSNIDGDWLMGGITPGYYVLFQIQPGGYFSLYDIDNSEDFDSLSNLNPNDNLIPVTVEPEEDDDDNIFAEVSSPGIISGYAFEDFDNNQSPGQIEGIQNVSIQLYRDNDQNGMPDAGGPISSTITSSIGFYTFGGLTIGHYVVVQVLPSGLTLVRDFDPTNDNDVVTNTNMTDGIIPVTLINNETDANNYFIYYQTCPQMVTNTNDNGPGSMRYVINCSAPGSTILFHPVLQNQTIHITSARIDINRDLNFYSGLSPRIKIQSDIPGAFRIGAGYNVEFKNIDIISGLSGFPGAAFENNSNLLLWDVTVKRNALLPPNTSLIHNSGAGVMTIKGNISIDN